MLNHRHALILLLTLPLFASCSAERIVDRPVPVEVVRTEYVPVPLSLTEPIAPATIPDNITYGTALTLWAQDRRALLDLNARLLEIRNLKNGERER